MEFASPLVRSALTGYGFENLPEEKYWSKKDAEILAEELIRYLSKNLGNKDIWIKFEFILEAIFDDDEFCIIFIDSLGEYFGNKNFALNLIERARSGDLMWSYDCYELIVRLEKLHEIHINKVVEGDSYN